MTGDLDSGVRWSWAQRAAAYIGKTVNKESEEVGSKRFDLGETFNPTEFDPAKWARSAKEAGMK